MMNNFIAAPSASIARMMEHEICREFRLDKKPVYITRNFEWERLAGLEQANIFVAISGREFAVMPKWPEFVKRLRLEFEVRMMRGPSSSYSKWIEVYLP